MLPSRCASLRQLLRRSKIPLGSCLRSCSAPVAARPLGPLPSRVSLPVVFQSSRRFSSSLEPLVKSKDQLSKDRYEAVAEGTLDSILESLETLADARPDVDVEYSAGVLTLIVPQGTYVLNKQPPNRQIWLSSPISGPKRYDWDQSGMDWIDTRDGSTLSGLIRAELGIEYDILHPIDV